MSLSELYTLAKFPRVSGTSERAKVATSLSGPEELHVAISGASISQYVLKPSPKLVWSHSVPPSFVITAVCGVSEGYVIGVFDKTKKKNVVQVVQKLENDSKVLKEWESASRVLDVAIVNGSLVVVYEDCVVAYDQEYNEVWTVKALYKSVFSQIIENDLLLVVEHESKKHNLNFKLLSMEGVEVSSKIIEFQTVLANLKFTYSNGVLYKYTTDTLTMYKLPRFESFKTLSTTEIGVPALEKSSITITSPASDRLLISQGSSLYLINTNFGIVLSAATSTKSKCELIYTQQSKKHTRSTSQLFAVVLRDTDIAGVNFTLDTNTLRDSLGKGNITTQSKKYTAVPSILNIQIEEVDIDTILTADDFDSALLKHLDAEQGYYTEKDRVVDSKFMNTVVSHALEQDEIPERAMTYLLTHPLFPPVDSLLSKLRPKPRLLRQAVVTANVSIEELVTELNNTENEEIFKDIITRLLEFPKEKLNFKDLDSFKIVERIMNLNFGHELIALLIDASGLFTWNEELIEKLQTVLQGKIDALNAASKALAMVEQVETKNLKTVQKVPVYSVEKLVL